MKYLIIIPARFKSSRFPGKPLANIGGKSMLFRVWQKCVQVAPSKDVLVATDDLRIQNHCKMMGMRSVLTKKSCLTGTDRISEVSKKYKADFYINVQGDEPFVKKSDIKKIINAAKKNPLMVHNAMCKINKKKEIQSHNVPKVVVNIKNNLLYISRSPIPGNKKNKINQTMKQVCIYSFSKNSLDKFSSTKKKTPLEYIEDIEILRFLELGIEVKMVEVSNSSLAVDTPNDLILANKIFKKK